MKKKIGLILIVFVSLFFISFYYGKILKSPNSYLFNPKGDGIKNYYTYAYHNANDTSIINFEGLNYPYGEHFLYTDCHPAFTVVIKLLSPTFPKLITYQIGIINFLMIFSLLITAVLVWYILVKYKVNPVYAVLPAFGIMIMQPQLFRMLGHLALSYSFFIPLTWLLLLKYLESKQKLLWSIIISFYTIFLFFIHGYLGMIAVSFLLSFYFFHVADNFKSIYKKKILYLYIFIQSVIPPLFFRFFIAFTDTHVGRTDNPWGFFVARADFDTIFIAHHKPLNPIWYKIINLHQTWEGWAYIGIASIIAIIIFLISSFIKSRKNKKFTVNNDFFPDKIFKYIFFASIITLLYSMALPFRAGLRFIVDDWIPLLKQFRAVGRFAWIFYYVITIWSSIYFYKKGKELLLKNKKLIAFILFALPALYIVEGVSYHQTTYKELVKSPNMFDYNQIDDYYKDALKNINPKNYRAIFPLPFYYINPDYGNPGTEKIFKITMILSYHLKLPIQGSYLGRTGTFEAKKNKQLLAPGYYPKMIKKDLQGNKPYLLVYSKEKLDKYETKVLNKAKKLYENKEFALYSLSLKDLFKNTAEQEIQKFNQIKDSLIHKNGFLCSDTSSYMYFNNFEDLPDKITFRGKGSFSADKEKYSILAEIPANKLTAGKKYTLSFWMYNEGRNFGQDVLNSSLFLEGENENGSLFRIAEANPTRSYLIDGDWSLVEMNFTPEKTNVKYRAVIKGGNIPKIKIHIDNLLIKEANTDIYKILKSDTTGIKELFKNNNVIKVK
ncbi:MAG: hypothetical protein GXO80_08400 [Chlorobi bacterium]|nr:hypothetical protein [Chlorobiota bacterium]